MNSLEFIVDEIRFYTIVKNEYIKMVNDERPENQKGYLKTLIKEYEQKLNHFQQIKAELEAWEIVQGTIAEGEDRNGHYCYIETVYFTGEKGKKVKQGLYNDETR